MDYIVEKEKAFKVAGVVREFDMETALTEIPAYWDTFFERYLDRLLRTGKPEGELEQAIWRYHVGMFGVCIEAEDGGRKFRYMIAGPYTGGELPPQMSVCEIPELTWAKFLCKGSLPGALQAVNRKIFNEWLPGNTQYDIAGGIHIEWYAEGDPEAPDYESAIWIPVAGK